MSDFQFLGGAYGISMINISVERFWHKADTSVRGRQPTVYRSTPEVQQSKGCDLAALGLGMGKIRIHQDWPSTDILRPGKISESRIVKLASV